MKTALVCLISALLISVSSIPTPEGENDGEKGSKLPHCNDVQKGQECTTAGDGSSVSKDEVLKNCQAAYDACKSLGITDCDNKKTTCEGKANDGDRSPLTASDVFGGQVASKAKVDGASGSAAAGFDANGNPVVSADADTNLDDLMNGVGGADADASGSLGGVSDPAKLSSDDSGGDSVYPTPGDEGGNGGNDTSSDKPVQTGDSGSSDAPADGAAQKDGKSGGDPQDAHISKPSIPVSQIPEGYECVEFDDNATPSNEPSSSYPANGPIPQDKIPPGFVCEEWANENAEF
ncbi:hypothetical protein MP638_004921 [Amoeboaphelidium occidentale]|nr:hypothetical protein MP638_004921 [Amoeboaphelidium occidentale]